MQFVGLATVAEIADAIQFTKLSVVQMNTFTSQSPNTYIVEKL